MTTTLRSLALWMSLGALAVAGCSESGGGDGTDGGPTRDGASSSSDGSSVPGTDGGPAAVDGNVAEPDGGAVAGDAGGGTDAATGTDGGPQSDGGGTVGAVCGVRGTPPCADGTYCDWEDGSCGRSDGPGVCTEIGDGACPEIERPVCGCDGETYSNPCFAKAAGVSIEHEGACVGSHCDPRDVLCRVAPPDCALGEVPEVEGICWTGDCVPIDACACTEPDACPFPEMYTCHGFRMRCGPYL